MSFGLDSRDIALEGLWPNRINPLVLAGDGLIAVEQEVVVVPPSVEIDGVGAPAFSVIKWERIHVPVELSPVSLAIAASFSAEVLESSVCLRGPDVEPVSESAVPEPSVERRELPAEVVQSSLSVDLGVDVTVGYAPLPPIVVVSEAVFEATATLATSFSFVTDEALQLDAGFETQDLLLAILAASAIPPERLLTGFATLDRVSASFGCVRAQALAKWEVVDLRVVDFTVVDDPFFDPEED